MYDLDAAARRINTLDDHGLAEFVNQVDGAIAECQPGAADPDILAVAATARILLRRRRDAAAMARATAIVDRLINSTETTE